MLRVRSYIPIINPIMRVGIQQIERKHNLSISTHGHKLPMNQPFFFPTIHKDKRECNVRDLLQRYTKWHRKFPRITSRNLPLNESSFCRVSWSRESIEGNPLLEAANFISSKRSSSISSIYSLANLRAAAFSMAAFCFNASLSLRSSSFCLFLSA